MTDSAYTNVLLEEVRGLFQVILETLSPMQEQVQHIPQMRADIANLKSDMKELRTLTGRVDEY